MLTDIKKKITAFNIDECGITAGLTGKENLAPGCSDVAVFEPSEVEW